MRQAQAGKPARYPSQCRKRKEELLRRASRQTPETVVGSVFIQLRECGEIEHAVDEHVDRTADGHDHLTDMDELGRPVADDMNTEQLLRRYGEQQLQEPVALTGDLAA